MRYKWISRIKIFVYLFGILTLLPIPYVKAMVSGPTFDYPQNGQTLDYPGSYQFRVNPVADAEGYLWGFFQNGILVWENSRDEGYLAGNEYGIWLDSPAYKKFSVGDVQVWVRAFANGAWTDVTIITIHLRYLVPVLVLAYYPPDPSNPAYLDPVETGWPGTLTTSMQAATQGMIEAGQALINDATRYRGYKDASAVQYLEYFTYGKIDYFYPIPRGYPVGDTQYKPHFNQILTNINICDYVDNHNVKEVWIYGYHTDVIVPDESKMSSRFGDVSNAYPKDEWIPVEYHLPRCINSYVMYNFTYQPGGASAIGNTIHNRMHQLENVIFFAEDLGYPPDNSNIVGSLFWDDFSVFDNRASLPGYRASCGNTHSPPNTTEGYDYDSAQYRENNCETWHPDAQLTTYVTANCAQWGCTDVGFYKWFMQNLPGYNNGIIYKGRPMRNWWEAMYDFNGFIDNGRSLFVTYFTRLPLVRK
jgi:hypothetical protein